MVYLSKSKYVKQLQCEKLLWLDTNKREAAEYSSDSLRRFGAGNRVGELAKEFFGAYADMTATRADGRLDIKQMKANTAAALARGESVIAEAALDAQGLYCAVDILKKTECGYAVYEVKSSLHVKAAHIVDAAYQMYVLGLHGLNVIGCNIITLDGGYVREGALDLQKLFKVHDITEQAAAHIPVIEKNIARARDVLSSGAEPDIACGRHCYTPYECPYINYCSGGSRESSIFEIYERKHEWEEKGYRTMRELLESGEPLTEIQRRQIEHTLTDLPVYADKSGIERFLSGVSYPLYFLDFETAMPEIPEFDGASPYTVLPFMFSLHYMKKAGELQHYEILSEKADPRREIAEALAENLSADGCIVAYNAAFERKMIRGLAEQFPDLAEKLRPLCDRFIDFLDVFKGGLVYTKEMGGSFSLKSVAPALLGKENIGYAGLSLVRDGNEAVSAYAELRRGGDNAEEIRRALYEYCRTDTLALVKILEKLNEIK